MLTTSATIDGPVIVHKNRKLQRRDLPRRTAPPTGHTYRAGPGDGGRGVWIYGRHPVIAALRNPARTVHRLLIARDSLPELDGLDLRIEPELADTAGFSAILPTDAAHQGFALLADPLADAGIELLTGTDGPALVLVLDQVTDPRNVGAILRSAAAFGATAILMQDRHSPPETGALAKAASGALEVVPVVRAINLKRALDALKEAGFWCLGLDANAELTLADVKPRMPERVAVMLGAEGAGLRRLIRDSADFDARFDIRTGPEAGGIDSLNVAATAAIALYELTRR